MSAKDDANAREQAVSEYERLVRSPAIVETNAAEIERLREWHDATAPIIAALAVYGERVNVAALVEKARALNEAKS